jgi:hypothetical protein
MEAGACHGVCNCGHGAAELLVDVDDRYYFRVYRGICRGERRRMMLHLYEVKYVGPQRPGSPERHWFELRTAKVIDEVMDGWAVRYIGSYETEEQATHMVDDLLDGDYRDPYDYDDYYEDEGIVRVYIADKNEHLSDEGTYEWMMPGLEELVQPETSDAEIARIAEDMENIAEAEDLELMHTMDLIKAYRDSLVD